VVDYFSDPWNYIDLAFNYASIINVILANTLGPFEIATKLVMILILLVGLFKTFFFLRIFMALSPIVTMLTKVISDLGIFLIFYVILIVLFSLLLGILGLGNRFIDGPFRDKYGGTEEYPGNEYATVGLFWGNVLTTLRMSMGDFSFDQALLLERNENIIYWVVWLLIVIITCIVFLNFIIAEASYSYENVSEKLDAYILSEQASLIEEAEMMLFERCKNKSNFPKYIIIREMED
jgi:hypothetical protein